MLVTLYLVSNIRPCDQASLGSSVVECHTKIGTKTVGLLFPHIGRNGILFAEERAKLAQPPANAILSLPGPSPQKYYLRQHSRSMKDTWPAWSIEERVQPAPTPANANIFLPAPSPQKQY